MRSEIFLKVALLPSTLLRFFRPLLSSHPLASSQGQRSSLESEAKHVVLASLGPQTTSEPQSRSPGGPRQSQQLAAKSPPTQIRAQSLNTGSFPGTDNTSRADRRRGAAPRTRWRSERLTGHLKRVQVSMRNAKLNNPSGEQENKKSEEEEWSIFENSFDNLSNCYR